MAIGTWYCIAGVTVTTTNRFAYRDGVPGTADVVSKVPTALDRTTVGCLVQNGARISGATGSVAHAAVWNLALNSAQLSSLAAGSNPLSLPDGLVGYWPIAGDESPEPDLSGGAVGSLTITGTPAKTTPDPPVDPPNLVYLPHGMGRIGP
jgi:hypothetical protein